MRLGNYLEIVLVFKDAKAYKLNINKHNATLEFPLSHKKKSLRVMRGLYLGGLSCQETDMSGYIFLWSLLAQIGLILLKKRWILTENLVRVHFKILGTSLTSHSQLVSIPFRTTPIDVPKTMYPDINTINIRKLFFHHLFGCIIHVIVCPSIYLF